MTTTALYQCDNAECRTERLSGCGLRTYGTCPNCNTGLLRRMTVADELAGTRHLKEREVTPGERGYLCELCPERARYMYRGERGSEAFPHPCHYWRCTAHRIAS